MKTNRVKKLLSVLVVAGLSLSTATLRAQSAADTAPQTASVASAPQLSYGASQILRLAQAKVGDGTIIAFIKNSEYSYALDAGQIIYLRQQGLSDTVISAMLNQPNPAVAAVAAPQTSGSTVTTASGTTVTTPNGSTATVAPTVTYVQSAPASGVYVIPDTQTYYYDSGFYSPYYYPYGWSYPAVSLSFGFGGGYHGGGFHGGGGYHGGGFHGGGRR
jgi:hypothetical protein